MSESGCTPAVIRGGSSRTEAASDTKHIFRMRCWTVYWASVLIRLQPPLLPLPEADRRGEATLRRVRQVRRLIHKIKKMKQTKEKPEPIRTDGSSGLTFGP